MAILIIYNNTASPLSYLSGTVTVAASGNTSVPLNKQYEIAKDGKLRHDLTIGAVYLNDGDDINYGSTDGIDYLDKILVQNTTLSGATDGTQIGNVSDALKVHTVNFPSEFEIKNDSGNPIPISGTVTATLRPSDIQRNAEFSITSKVETDIAGVSYTVTNGKTFYLTQFAVASDSPSPVAMRLRVYNGATLVNTVKINIASNGAWGGHSWPNGVAYATGGMVVKATFDPQAAKGAGWAMFAGFEV